MLQMGIIPQKHIHMQINLWELTLNLSLAKTTLEKAELAVRQARTAHALAHRAERKAKIALTERMPEKELQVVLCRACQDMPKLEAFSAMTQTLRSHNYELYVSDNNTLRIECIDSPVLVNRPTLPVTLRFEPNMPDYLITCSEAGLNECLAGYSLHLLDAYFAKFE